MTCRFDQVLLVLRLALTVCAIGAPPAAWSVERTIHLAPPFVPPVTGARFEQIPSDAEIPGDWRKRGDAVRSGAPQAAPGTAV